MTVIDTNEVDELVMDITADVVMNCEIDGCGGDEGALCDVHALLVDAVDVLTRALHATGVSVASIRKMVLG